MKFQVPKTQFDFEIPDDWWKESGLESFERNGDYYVTNVLACSGIVLIEEVEPPRRKDGEFWYRDKDSLVQVLTRIASGDSLAPIEVWSKERKKSRKYVVRDGFHRYYASIAVGYPKIPIKVSDFDLKEFLENERVGET